MDLAGDDIKTNVVQLIHQGSGVGNISQHGETVTACSHIENAKYPSSISKVDISFP